AVALLAALGAERVARAEPGRALAVLAALGGASLLGAMAIGQRQLGVALSIAWVAEGLLSLAAILRWVPLGPWRQWALVAFCAADAVLCSFRVPLQDDGEGCGAFLAGAAARLGGGRLDAVSGTALVHGLGFTLPGSGLANVCLLGDRPAQYGLPSIRFYGTPAPAGVQSVLDRLGATGDGLLGATLLLRSGPSAVPGLVPIAAPELAPLWAATIPDAAPRVELRPTARVSADVEGDTARETLAEARREVLLDEPPPPPSAAGAPSAGPEAATLTADEGERVVVDTASTGERWLVLADLYYPGWVATVDGVPAPIRRAYGMIRAVRLGPGRHRVVFDYRPASVRVGALVSLLAAMALILSLRGLSPPRPRLDLEMRAKG
ncbi:MAG TPA: YfhO family protein, partial [Myxococcales bacterium]|nr:YfhO family protein [Myxococcales bacterium]